jgi:hypothetical protein
VEEDAIGAAELAALVQANTGVKLSARRAQAWITRHAVPGRRGRRGARWVSRTALIAHIERKGWLWANKIAQKYRANERRDENLRAEGKGKNPNMRRPARTTVRRSGDGIHWSAKGRAGEVLRVPGGLPSRIRGELLRPQRPLKRLVKGALWRNGRCVLFDADARRAMLYQ